MNYEVDQYIEAGRRLPSREVSLYTMDGEYFLFKADILSNMVTYSTDRRTAANLTTIPARRALDIIEMNRRGEKPDTLEEGGHKVVPRPVDLAAQDDLNRFDKKKKKKKKSGGKPHAEGQGQRTDNPGKKNKEKQNPAHEG
jgi:hypothetical protein